MEVLILLIGSCLLSGLMLWTIVKAVLLSYRKRTAFNLKSNLRHPRYGRLQHPARRCTAVCVFQIPLTVRHDFFGTVASEKIVPVCCLKNSEQPSDSSCYFWIERRKFLLNLKGDKFMQPYLRVEHQLLRDGAAFSSVHEKMVYLLLQSYAGRDGLAFPSHQTLADAVPCGKTTVKNCLQTLVEKGWIEKVERFDRHGGQTSNGYRIRAGSPGASGQVPGHETTSGETSVASKEKGVKKPSLKKEPPSPGVKEIITHFETEIGRDHPVDSQAARAFVKRNESRRPAPCNRTGNSGEHPQFQLHQSHHRQSETTEFVDAGTD